MTGYVLAGFYGIGLCCLGFIHTTVTLAGISMFSGFIQNAHLISDFLRANL